MKIKVNTLFPRRDSILLFFMGFLCFSAYSSRVSIQYLHLPLSLPELFFIPLFYLLKRYFKPIVFDGNKFIALFLLLIFLVLWSQVLGTFSLYSVLSSARGYLYLFLFYCVFKNDTQYDNSFFIPIFFGAIIGWFIVVLHNYRDLLLTGEPNAQGGNMLAIALFMMYCMLQKKWPLFFSGLVFILFINVATGTRRVILVTAIAFILPVLLQLWYNKKSIFRMAIVIALVIVPISLSYNIIKESVESTSPLLYQRVFARSEASLSGETVAGDDKRSNDIKNLFDSPLEYAYPKGMVTNQYLTDKGTGIFMDFPFLALCHIFGFPLACYIVFYFCLKSYKSLLYFRKTKNVDAGVFGAMGGILLVLLFVEGSFLVHPFTTPMTGMCLGRMAFYSKQYSSLRRKKYHI